MQSIFQGHCSNERLLCNPGGMLLRVMVFILEKNGTELTLFAPNTDYSRRAFRG